MTTEVVCTTAIYEFDSDSHEITDGILVLYYDKKWVATFAAGKWETVYTKEDEMEDLTNV